MIKSNTNQTLFAKRVLGKIVLAALLKDFSVRTMQEFKPDILLKAGDSLINCEVNANIIALPGHTKGSIGIDVDNTYLIVGDGLMNMFYPTVSMLYHDKNAMLESAKKKSGRAAGFRLRLYTFPKIRYNKAVTVIRRERTGR